MLDHLHRATVDGADIRYLRVGRGRPIVLLHTLRTQLEYFDRLLEHVDTGRVEVIAIDLPGHGESSAPAVDYTAGYFTDTVGRCSTCSNFGTLSSSASRSAARSRSRSPPEAILASPTSWPSTHTTTVAGAASAAAPRSRTCSSLPCSGRASDPLQPAPKRRQSSAASSQAAFTTRPRCPKSWSKSCLAAAGYRGTRARSVPSAGTGEAGSTRAPSTARSTCR